MNKKALFGKIIITLVIVIALVIFLARYIILDKGNVEITTGEVTISIDYNNTQDNTIFPAATPAPINQTNKSQQSLNNSLDEE